MRSYLCSVRPSSLLLACQRLSVATCTASPLENVSRASVCSYHHCSRVFTPDYSSILKAAPNSNIIQCRHKYRKSKGKNKDTRFSDSDSDESEDEIVLEKGVDFKDFKYRVPSLRLDVIAKAGLNLSRIKTEGNFYVNKFRVNGKKCGKKSQSLSVGDELDYIKGVRTEGMREFNEVTRLQIKQLSGLEDDSDKLTVVIRKYNHLLLPLEEMD